MTIKLVNIPTEGKDVNQTENRVIYDTEGYQYIVGPNDHLTSCDDGRFAQCASNATVYVGSDVQQETSPEIQVDILPFGTPGRA